MKINFNQKMLTLNGRVIYDGDQSLHKELTLLLVSQNALLSLSKEDANMESKEKIDRYNLALKITMSKDPEVDVTAEDIVLLKKLIGKIYATLIVGQVFLMLEGLPTGIVEVIDEVVEK